MNLLLEKKYSGAVEVFKQNIVLLERDQGKAKGDEASLMHSTLDNAIAVLHCNCAIAEYGMGLYRKCIKSCTMAVKHDPTNIKAYHIEGKAYVSMGKRGHAQATWQEGIDKITDYCDVDVALSLMESLASLQESAPLPPAPPSAPSPTVTTSSLPATTSTSVSTSVSSNKPAAIASSSSEDMNSTTSPSFSSASSSTPTTSRQPPAVDTHLPLPPPPPTATTTGRQPSSISPSTSKRSGGAADAIAALGGKDRKVGMEQLKIIENHFIGFRPNQIHPDVIKAASQSVANACGESTVDNLISMGYLLVNNNKLTEACELFTTLLQYRLDLLAAYLGLGSCWAMTGRMQEAVKAFSSAIELDPKCVDAWKRRGQTNAALDRVDEGLADLRHALTLGPNTDDDIHFHVGSTLHQKKHFQAALDSFYTYQQKGGSKTGKFFNFLGMCHSQLGDVDQALEYFNQAINLDQTLIESTINCAQILKESGRGDEADRAFENVMRFYNSNKPAESRKTGGEGKVDMSRQVFQYRAALQYSLGNYMEALGYLRRYLGDEHDSRDDPLKRTGRVNALVQSALCLQNLGQYSEALIFFDDALKLIPDSTCCVQKQLLVYYLRQIDYGWDEFCVDIDFNAQWKESFCKYNNTVTQHEAPFVIRTYDYSAGDDDDMIDELSPSYDVGPELKNIIEISRGLSGWIQLDTPGFLLNSRQHKTFGLATLQMAKKLSRHCDLIISQCDDQMKNPSSNKSAGLQVLNSGASGCRSVETTKAGSEEEGDTHTFMFRDFFDVVVKWRQISEPNDPVWWIDGLTKKSFQDGFGLHTPMVNGELKCIRYYPYFDMGFDLLKKLLVGQDCDYFVARGEQKRTLTEAKKRLISVAASLDDVYAIIGEDFWVVCPCRSSIHHQVLLEGTRLTLCSKNKKTDSTTIGSGDSGDGGSADVGFDFSIRTPGLPERWKAMEAELTACFDSTVKQLLLLKRMDKVAQSTPSSNTVRETAHAQLTREALRLFYYWVNFAPLTRGSAMCGYAAVMAVILASGRTIENSIPKGKQLDWEAIFTEDSNEFIAKFGKALHIVPSAFSLADDVDFESAMPSLYDVLQSLQLP